MRKRFVVFVLIFALFHVSINAGGKLYEDVNVANKLLSFTETQILRDRNAFINEVNRLHANFELYRESDFKDSSSIKKYQELTHKIEKLDIIVNLYADKNLADTFAYDQESGVMPFSYKLPETGNSWRFGDILYYGIGNNNADGDKSLSGHTAVMSTVKHFVIEAAKTKRGAKVFHWDRKVLWEGASGILQLKVTDLNGKDASISKRLAAVQYGLKQVGKPYALRTSIWSTDAWYCSKLTNAQWSSVGYDLRSARAFYLNGQLMVLPIDIKNDANTRVIKNWGTKLPH